MLRMLLGTGTSGHSPLARLVALLVIIGLVGLSASALIPALRWIVDLL